MILRMRRRLTLLVIAVLAVVAVGIVFSISYFTYRNVDRQAFDALQAIARGQGLRFGPPAPFDENAYPEDARPPEPQDRQPLPGGMPSDAEPEDLGESIAPLSNFYVIELDVDGSVAEWTSDRADLYTDEQVSELARRVVALDSDSGRMGTQYYRILEQDGSKRILVLDARLQRMNAANVLRTTTLVAALASLALSIGATLLIRQMVKPVETAFERQKQFVWDASHEFKTPLAVISANAEVLAGEIGKNEYLDYIMSEVHRTDRLVQSLLTLARMDKGSVAAQMERFDLSKSLLSVALPFESTVFEAGRTLEIDVPDGVFIRGDSEMLQQLTVILLSNALKYSNEGGVIRLSLSQRNHGCRLSVFNTGAGIAPEHLDRVFDRFYREDASHSSAVAGNGLGLAIARNIVDAHRGRIYAESEFGRSATFTVILP